MKPEEKDEPEVEEKEEIETPEETVEEEVKEPAVTSEAPLAAPKPEAAPLPAAPAAPAPAQTPPAAAQPSNDQPIMLDEIKAGTSPEVEPEPAVQTPADKAQQMTNENLKFADDLSFGRIKPKTYGDLYHSKDTVGKIGTIFGLMLGGMGSGLTGQPNALLSLMDKEIERDLEAQKKDQENKQSWYNIALNQAMNEPEIAMKLAQAEGIESENLKRQYVNAQLGIAKDEASTNLRNMKRLHALKTMTDMVNKMPEGPQKIQGLQMINGTIAPAVMAAVQNDNAKFSQKKAFVEAATPAPQMKTSAPPKKGFAEVGKHYDVMNEKEFNRRAQLGRVLGPDAGKSPDAIPESDVEKIRQEKKDLAVNRKNLADAVDTFWKLDAMAGAGERPIGQIAGVLGKTIGGITGSGAALAGPAQKYFENARQTQLRSLANRLAHGHMTEEQAKELAESILPSMADSDEVRHEKFIKLQEHFKGNKIEEAPTMEQYRLKNKVPNYEFRNPYKEKIDKIKTEPEKKSEPQKEKAESFKRPGRDF